MRVSLNRVVLAVAGLLAIPLVATPAAMAQQAGAQLRGTTTIRVGALPTGIAVDPATNHSRQAVRDGIRC